MSKLRKDIDNKNLFDILNKAVQVDKMYWIQNDAKIRASYTSQNYDEFRETVAAAHLVPIQIKDKIKKQDSWNYLNQGNEDIE